MINNFGEENIWKDYRSTAKLFYCVTRKVGNETLLQGSWRSFD